MKDMLPRISDYPRAIARITPEAEALVLGDARIGYRALADRVDALARALLAAGIRKGDRVATLQTPHPDFLVAFLATAAIGGIWVGLNPKYRLEELAHVIQDSRPSVLIARARVPGRDFAPELTALMALPDGPAHLVTFEDDARIGESVPMRAFVDAGRTVAGAALDAARDGCGGRDACLIVYTSGSTGRPKGALLHHEGIIAFSLAQNEVWPVHPQRVLNFLPINHVGCLIDITTPVLCGGGTVVFMEHFDPAEALAMVARERLTVWGGVPSIFMMQLGLPDFASYDLSSVQMIVWEGAALPAEMIARLRQIKPRLATNYGLTETCSAATILAPTDDLDRLANSVGDAFPGVEIRLVDESGAAVADGTPGEVQTRGCYNMLGYWNNPAASAAAFTPDGFLRTGDVALRRPDGAYRIVGRIKDMYKSGGYNVYPREVEAALEAHPSVAAAVVVSRADPLWQEVGIAFVVPRAAVDPQVLEDWARDKLANYKIPKRIVLTDDLPLLPIGKVDRRALEARARDMK
jgi:acyl-CoA synthetase (AMP-forming)/AMP-acid ligase II